MLNKLKIIKIIIIAIDDGSEKAGLGRATVKSSYGTAIYPKS